jgi:hypothetical protein
MRFIDKNPPPAHALYFIGRSRTCRPICRARFNPSTPNIANLRCHKMSIYQEFIPASTTCFGLGAVKRAHLVVRNMLRLGLLEHVPLRQVQEVP